MNSVYCSIELWEQCCRFASPTTSGMQRRWHDGSLENDLPFRQLSEMFNVNHFVVSQTNPHLVPLMTLKKVVPGPIFNMVKAEVKHAFAQVRFAHRTGYFCSRPQLPRNSKEGCLSKHRVLVGPTSSLLSS